MRFDQPARILSSGELDMRFGPRSRLQIAPWSAGFGMRVVCAQGSRRAYLPNLTLLATESGATLDPAVRCFVAGIPGPIRDAVAPFRAYGQLALLHWSARWKEAYDLLVSNPKLLWLVAAGLCEGLINHAELLPLLQSKQPVILSRLLGHEASRAQLKLLHKVRLERAGLEEARTLLAVLANRQLVKLLRHQTAVPIALAKVLHQFPYLATATMLPTLISWTKRISLGALCFEGPFPGSSLIQVVRLCEKVLRTGEALGIDRTASAIARCRTLAELTSLHNGWMPELSTQFDGAGPPDLFPAPPIPDDQNIRAIRHPADLAAESQEMSHCVKSYTDAALRGECCIYRVLAPQRGTLEIKRLSDQRLAIGQFKLAHNGTPSAESWARVRAWFDRHGGHTSIRPRKPDR